MAKKATKVPSKTRKTGSREDVIALILKDHKPLKSYIRIMKSETASAGRKRAAFEKFAPTLIAHAKPEENSLYLALKDDDETRQEGIEGDIEHALADQLIEELKSERDEELFVAKVKVLAELVEHHIEEEEEEMLPDFRKSSDLEERRQLGRKYLALKQGFSEKRSGERRKTDYFDERVVQVQ